MSWATSLQGELWPLEVREGWAARASTFLWPHDSSHRLVPPVVPKPQLFAKLVGNAFAIAVVGFAIAVSLGKIFALRHGYRVDGNQVWGMGRGACGGSLVYRRPQGLGGRHIRGTQGDSKPMCWDHVGTEGGRAASLSLGLPRRGGGWGCAG